MPLYIVETLVQVKHVYYIEADELEHAYDEVTMKDSGHPLDEFDPVESPYLGETIFSGREHTGNLPDESLIRKIDYTR